MPLSGAFMTSFRTAADSRIRLSGSFLAKPTASVSGKIKAIGYFMRVLLAMGRHFSFQRGNGLDLRTQNNFRTIVDGKKSCRVQDFPAVLQFNSAYEPTRSMSSTMSPWPLTAKAGVNRAFQ